MSKQPTVIDTALMDATTDAARNAPRGRRNHNFHAADDAQCHRLINAIEPGSYIQPHRHNDPAKAEAMIILRGKLGCVFFDDTGNITSHCVLAPGSDCVAIDIPPGIFHTVFALEPGTVFFEAKAGPYVPLTEDEKASWAPRESEDEARALLSAWASLT